MASVNDHDNAAYIAAASPDVVLALIAEIESLNAEVTTFHLDKQTMKYQNTRLARNNLELRTKNEWLQSLNEKWKHDYEILAASSFDSRQFVQRLKSGE